MDIKKRPSVISPMPPICMSMRMIQCPNVVKLSSGMVKSPVTQVADVAVKKRSIKAIGCVRDMGKARRNVPHKIVEKRESKSILPGEK